MSATFLAFQQHSADRRVVSDGVVPTALLVLVAVTVLAGGAARADPFEGCRALPAWGAAGMPVLLAGLGAGEAVSPVPFNLGRIVPVFDGTTGPATGTEPIVVAGRCGSSQYRCDSPGFTYCCGNSTDGFYCAPDVNGCTR
jgi:hypothetical protein